jgi:hypothetical protein
MAVFGWYWGVNGIVGGVLCANLLGMALAGREVNNHLQGLGDNRDISMTAWHLLALALLCLLGWQYGGLGTSDMFFSTVVGLLGLTLQYCVVEWLNYKAGNVAQARQSL